MGDFAAYNEHTEQMIEWLLERHEEDAVLAGALRWAWLRRLGVSRDMQRDTVNSYRKAVHRYVASRPGWRWPRSAAWRPRSGGWTCAGCGGVAQGERGVGHDHPGASGPAIMPPGDPHLSPRTTNALLALRDWLIAEKVSLVVLEATGAYWPAAATGDKCPLTYVRDLRFR
jgi:hypothetical protein